MEYIKNDIEFLEIPSGYKVNLAYAFANPGVVNKNALTKDIVNGYYKDRDFELLKTLCIFRFATFEQLCSILKIEDEVVFRGRLSALISRRIINKFELGKEYKSLVGYGDALVAYCLDFAGVELLLHNYDNSYIANYEVAMNIQDSALIGKRLFVTEFYTQLLKSVPKEEIEIFDPTPMYNIIKVYGDSRAVSTKFMPSFAFSINKGNNIKYYTCQVVHPQDLGLPLREIIANLNESLIKTKAWVQNFRQEDKNTVPTLLLFTNNEKSVETIATVVANESEIKTYRLATESNVRKGLGRTGAFYKNEDNVLKAVTLTVFKTK